MRIHNFSNEPVRLLGSGSSCNCVVAGPLPPSVPAGEAQDISVKVRFVGDGPFKQHLEFFTDSPSQPTLLLVLEGETVKLVESD